MEYVTDSHPFKIYFNEICPKLFVRKPFCDQFLSVNMHSLKVIEKNPVWLF